MKRKLIVLAAGAALVCLGTWTQASVAQTSEAHQHSFSGAERWASAFDDPKRDEWQKPRQVIQALALAPDSVIADIGSGTGYFAARLAPFVPKGRVYGVDIEPDMVKYLAERAKREGLANVISIAGEPDSPRLPVKVDVILMVNVYHHISDREQYFRKLRQVLKPGGRIALIDHNDKASMGPPMAYRIRPDQVKSQMSKSGYTLQAEHAFLPEQYFLVFAPARR